MNMVEHMRTLEQHKRKRIHWDSMERRPGEWCLDFDQNPPRRYREKHGVVVYDTGMAYIRSYVYNDPALRGELWDGYGLDFRLVSEIRGIEFTTIDGEAVPKAHIKDDVLMLDWTSMRVFAPRGLHWGEPYGIHIACPGAIPTSLARVTIDKPDRKRIKELLKINAEAINVLVTTHNLHTSRTNTYSLRRQRVENAMTALTNGSIVDLSALDAEDMAIIGAALVPSAIKDTFNKRVRITTQHEYLKFTYKE